jgi:hypothetical protein
MRVARPLAVVARPTDVIDTNTTLQPAIAQQIDGTAPLQAGASVHTINGRLA